jgi:hypothetical protein
MPTYVAELWHGPDMSPVSNPVARALANGVQERMPELLAKKGIKKIGDWHLDPEHRAFVVLEAPNVEVVRDLLYESGLMGYCDGRIYPARSLAEVHKWAAAQEIPRGQRSSG